MAPPPVASPLPVHAPAAIPAIPSSAAAPFVPAALPVALPSTAPAFSSPLAVSPSVASPATDYSGLKAFVGRIRGLDHLDLPRVFDGGTQPLAHPSAATAAPTISSPSAFFDIDAVRRDFPILQEKVHGKPLAWFDNAATTQKPQAVIDAISHFYAHDNSNIHRGAHTLAARATDAYEHELLHYATGRLTAIDGLRLIGTAREKVGVLSFVLEGHDPIEVGKALDREGFAVRAGHHCAQPSLRHFGVEATVRPSLAFYNTRAEIDRLADAVAALAQAR